MIFQGGNSAANGIVITYPSLDIELGHIQVTLRCNQTAPATSDVNFVVDRVENATIYLTGYSHYGNNFLIEALK